MSTRYLALASAVLIGGAVWPQSTHVAPNDSHLAAEVARLRTHFDAVDVELRTRNVSTLSAQQYERRAQLIEWLRDYRDAGAFPVNDGYADVAVPIFRDRAGTLCAMAYLIERSGRGDIVDRVANSRNTAYIRELADDPELVAWLKQWGLSESEAARIQPAYGPAPEPGPADSDVVSSEYALLSMALAGTSLATTYINLTDESGLSSTIGLLAGGSTAIAGLVRLDERGGRRSVAVANTAVGIVAMGAALHGLNWLRGDDSGTAMNQMRLGGADLTITPDVVTVADRSGPGIVFHARF